VIEDNSGLKKDNKITNPEIISVLSNFLFF